MFKHFPKIQLLTLVVALISATSFANPVSQEKAKEVAKADGYKFMQVKTVKMGMYEDYDRTNRFYISCGFKEFEVFPLLWDEANPCQIYVMSL